MKDFASVYVIPKFDDEYNLIGWGYEVLHNNRLTSYGGGYATSKEAREAGEETVGKNQR